MKHTFKSLAGSPAICLTCNKDVTAHSEFATCEVCKKFPCTVYIVGDYAMCDGCKSDEIEAASQNKSIIKPIPEPIARLEQQFVKNGNGKREFTL